MRRYQQYRPFRDPSYRRLDKLRGIIEDIIRIVEKKPPHPDIIIKRNKDVFTEARLKTEKLYSIEVPSMDFYLPLCGLGQRIHIARKEFTSYSDDGITFRTYVGDNWDADREQFREGLSVSAKMYNRPRTYLRYEAVCRCDSVCCPHMHTNMLNPIFRWADKNDHREYAAGPSDTLEYATSDVIEEFIDYSSSVLMKLKGEQSLQ